MSDYIDRQAAIIAVNGVLANHIPTLLPQYEDIPLECARAIMKIPSAEVEPVKHGRWINDKGLYRCSECNELWTGWWANVVPIDQMNKTMRYCPHCGAKMDAEEVAQE